VRQRSEEHDTAKFALEIHVVSVLGGEKIGLFEDETTQGLADEDHGALLLLDRGSLGHEVF